MPREAAGLSGSGQMRVTEDRVTVAVDVMGGDHAPREILLGALEGASRHMRASWLSVTGRSLSAICAK